MNKTDFDIRVLHEADFDSLHPLVEEFILTHQSLSFREDYWGSFCNWLERRLNDENTLSLCAKIDARIVGFVLGIIKENGPLLSPDRVGYVSIMVVEKNHRRIGIGEALWKELRDWFLSKDVSYVELYTEFGNELSGTFWRKRGFDTFLERRRQHVSKI